jgi:hypothetical protein
MGDLVEGGWDGEGWEGYMHHCGVGWLLPIVVLYTTASSSPCTRCED